ncbi:MAG: prolyl oligopeptidase family serine peptidase [Gemmatimonadales bacterium]|nr:prolyl oligopeptidase family serine peptidase [Gemmatimonadales bacterium]NIN10017.1 prolyl oligopeptidase family serine peptidase [Gemmatimonadales bacterium]NIQ98669.1 prolyl oligopeptidase family serine peptidase [Gemmatimonadales bacterium]NIS63546.1 prolyl oligopeptidase family serine peptidase [Gemmatimonadales bacterium]
MQLIRRTRSVLSAVLAAIATPVSSAAAQQLTSEMVVDLKQVTSVAMQPQGEYVAYTLRVPRGADEDPGGTYSEIWVVSTRGGAPKQFTSKPVSAFAPAWLPDGSMITFLSRRRDRDANTQVYGIPLDGGEARQLSHAPRGVSSYAVSPDGSVLAYTMGDEVPAEVRKARQAGFDQRVEGTWTTITRLYVENLTTGESHQVTQDDVHVRDFSWSPDGTRLLYRASDRPFTDDGYMFTDNYSVAVTGGSGELVHDTEGKLTAGRYSPDGEYIAWLGGVSLNDPTNGSLFLMPATGGQPTNLTVDFPGTAAAYTWKDDGTILLTTIEKTRTFLYEVSVPEGRMKKLRGDSDPIFRGVSISRDGRRYATIASTPTHPNEVFVGSSNGRSLDRLTQSNPGLASMSFGEQETISWIGPDDWEISGVLIKPVGYQEGVRYPLQLQVHGGPESAYLDGWNTSYSTLAQMLAQRGVMVLMPNYRGSTGRGVAFAKGDHNDPMGKQFEDMLAGVDYLIDLGYVDPDRVAVGGGSYGGYTSAWAATKHSERFAAAVVFAGIANQVSKIGMTDTPAENALVHWNLWHWDDLELVWDRSPIKHIQNARTPTLIGHGERDLRVPTGQAFELYRGLKHMKVPTELVIYPREPHGLRERAHQIDFNRRALEWYLRYLGTKATY